MTDLPFIAAGWIGTTAALAVYAVTIRLRTRRARAATKAGPAR